MDYALRVLKNSSFDWVAIEVNWAELQPDPNQPIHLHNLDTIFESLQSSQQKLFVRLVNAPSWALTVNGPDIQASVRCLMEIINLYPTLQAVEVFPGANLQRFWGAAPSAHHYMSLLTSLAASLEQNQINMMLIVGGLMQVGDIQDQQNINDLIYLQSLYDLGLKNLNTVISIQFENLPTDPEIPAGSSSNITLRHYEYLRQVMINNADQSRMMWVTKLTPSSQIGANQLEQQAQWMEKALTLIRSQLYIQLCVLQPINPNNIAAKDADSLITQEGTLNPIVKLFSFYRLKLNNSFSNNVLKWVQQKQNLIKHR
jgi:hypothetical protein